MQVNKLKNGQSSPEKFEGINAHQVSGSIDERGNPGQKPNAVAPPIEQGDFESNAPKLTNESKRGDEIRDELTLHLSPLRPKAGGDQLKLPHSQNFSQINHEAATEELQRESQKQAGHSQPSKESKTRNVDVPESPIQVAEPTDEEPTDEELINDLYHKHVPAPLSCDPHRKKNTLALFQKLSVKANELEAFLEQTKNWQSGRVWGQGLTVFTAGFFLMSAFNYANATHGFKFSGDPEVNKLASFLMSCVIAGCGGVFGSNIITKGGLEPKYFDTKWKKDSKLVPYLDTVRGKLVEYSSFWGFSVGHSLVEVAFKNRQDPVAKAAAKWASACAATFMTCLHKQMMPPLLLLRDPMLLDASTPQKEQAVSALIAEMRKENPTPVSDYMKQWGRGLKATLGIPSTTQLVRALIHTFMVVIALSGMLASQSSSNHAYELAIAGSVAIGLIWGAGSRASRAAIQEIEQNAVRLDRAQSNKGRQIEVVSEAVSSRVNDVAPRDDNKS